MFLYCVVMVMAQAQWTPWAALSDVAVPRLISLLVIKTLISNYFKTIYRLAITKIESKI